MVKQIPFPKDLPPGSVPAFREVIDRLYAIERANETGQTEANNKGIAAAIDGLARQINALPIPIAAGATVSPITATGFAWVTKATATITVPQGKELASLGIMATVVLLDTVSGGIAAPPYARIVITGGGALPTTLPVTGGIPATKDTGASNVNNVVSFGQAHTRAVQGGQTITVELQVIVSHSTAYNTPSAGNIATVSVQGSFS